MKNKKAQSAIEFIILIMFLLFFFILFFVSIQESMSDKVKEQKNLVVKEIASTVQDEINLASKASDGYSRKFKIPEKISNQDYYLSITGEMVYLKTLDEKSAIALPVPEITGQVIKGENTIRKENGVVYLN